MQYCCILYTYTQIVFSRISYSFFYINIYTLFFYNIFKLRERISFTSYNNNKQLFLFYFDLFFQQQFVSVYVNWYTVYYPHSLGDSIIWTHIAANIRYILYACVPVQYNVANSLHKRLFDPYELMQVCACACAEYWIQV